VEKHGVTAYIKCKTYHQIYLTRFLHKVMLKNTIRLAGTKLSYWPAYINGHVVECSNSCWQVFNLKDAHTALLSEDYKRKNLTLIDDKTRIIKTMRFNLVSFLRGKRSIYSSQHILMKECRPAHIY
jgi:hypothetical protein